MQPREVAPRIDLAAFASRGDEVEHWLHLGLRQLVEQAMGSLAGRHASKGSVLPHSQRPPGRLKRKGCGAILPKLLAPSAAAIAGEQAEGRITG